jgi:Zn-finger nucleic acid-binding protein
MQCPVCKDPQLVISERQGIEIDYCPSCRGVWLDRGELDKLIEKAAASMVPQQPAQPQQPVQRHRDDSRSYDDSRYGHQKKPKSWLSDLFD